VRFESTTAQVEKKTKTKSCAAYINTFSSRTSTDIYAMQQAVPASLFFYLKKLQQNCFYYFCFLKDAESVDRFDLKVNLVTYVTFIVASR